MKYIKILVEGILAFLSSFTIIAGVLLAFVNIAVRFLLNQSIEWAFELTNYLFIYSAFFGAAYLFSRGANIKVTILLDIMPKFLSKIMVVFVDFLNIVYLGIVIYFSYVFIFDPDLGVKASGEVSVDLGVKMWIVYLILPISGILAFIAVLLKFKDDLFTPSSELAKKEEEDVLKEGLEEMSAGGIK